MNKRNNDDGKIDWPDYSSSVSCVENEHDEDLENGNGLRLDLAEHSIGLLLLQVPSAADEDKRSSSIGSSFTDMDVPILRERLKDFNNATSPWTKILILSIFASAAGSGFPHGYNTGVINAPQEKICFWLRQMLGVNAEHPKSASTVTMVWSVIVSIMCVGGMIGGLASGYMISNFGPRTSLLLNNVILITAIIFEGLAKPAGSYSMLIVGRLITGINSGISSGICPLYLHVISRIDIRGTTASAYQFFVTLGIFVSQIMALDKVLGTVDHWPYLFWLLLAIVVFQLTALSFCPESPTYLYANGKEESARQVLAKLRRTDDIEEEFSLLKEESDEQKNMNVVSLKDMFNSQMYRRPTIIIIVIMIAQQFSGINAIMYFSTSIFKLSGLDGAQSQIATIFMGLVNVSMTVVSVIMVDRTGRKVLLLTGFAGMFVCSILLTAALTFADQSFVISFGCIALVILFVMFFAAGTGSIPWFLVSELFYPNAIPIATSVGICVNWTANAMVGLFFLPLKDIMNTYVFLLFAALQLIFFIFIWKEVPETKDRSLEQIYAEFRRRKYGTR